MQAGYEPGTQKTNITIDANTKQNDQRNPWFIYSYRSGSAVGERAFSGVTHYTGKSLDASIPIGQAAR